MIRRRYEIHNTDIFSHQPYTNTDAVNERETSARSSSLAHTFTVTDIAWAWYIHKLSDSITLTHKYTCIYSIPSMCLPVASCQLFCHFIFFSVGALSISPISMCACVWVCLFFATFIRMYAVVFSPRIKHVHTCSSVIVFEWPDIHTVPSNLTIFLLFFYQLLKLTDFSCFLIHLTHWSSLHSSIQCLCFKICWTFCVCPFQIIFCQILIAIFSWAVVMTFFSESSHLMSMW